MCSCFGDSAPLATPRTRTRTLRHASELHLATNPNPTPTLRLWAPLQHLAVEREEGGGEGLLLQAAEQLRRLGLGFGLGVGVDISGMCVSDFLIPVSGKEKCCLCRSVQEAWNGPDSEPEAATPTNRHTPGQTQGRRDKRREAYKGGRLDTHAEDETVATPVPTTLNHNIGACMRGHVIYDSISHLRILCRCPDYHRDPDRHPELTLSKHPNANGSGGDLAFRILST